MENCLHNSKPRLCVGDTVAFCTFRCLVVFVSGGSSQSTEEDMSSSSTRNQWRLSLEIHPNTAACQYCTKTLGFRWINVSYRCNLWGFWLYHGEGTAESGSGQSQSGSRVASPINLQAFSWIYLFSGEWTG